MPAADFPQQTLCYLEAFNAKKHLESICQKIGVSPDGTKGQLWRRIMREVGFREGWISKPQTISEADVTTSMIRPFVKWHILKKRPNYEKDLYPSIQDELEDILGPDLVHPQLPIAHGSTLKVDFHVGHPQRGGVGIEIKMPANNSEIQKAIGQLEQYQCRYGQELIIVLLTDFLSRAQAILFCEALESRGIHAEAPRESELKESPFGESKSPHCQNHSEAFLRAFA